VEPDRVQEFLDLLPVGRLWGVGRVSDAVLERFGIRTIGQLRAQSPELLRQNFGKTGDHLWQLAHGIDDRLVVPDREAKSISHETTFATDIDDIEVLRTWLLELTEQVARRLRRHQLRGRTVQLKVRFADFSTITRSQTLDQATNVSMELWRAADELLTQRLPGRRLPVRLLGMGVSGLDASGQQQRTLFDEDGHKKQSQLDAIADQIRERFGATGLERAATMLHGARPVGSLGRTTRDNGPDSRVVIPA
jgi:DNA polymerase-4